MRIAFPLYLITLLFPVIGSIPPPEEPLDLVIHRVAPRDSVLTDYLRQLILNHETDFDADYYLMDCTESGFGDNMFFISLRELSYSLHFSETTGYFFSLTDINRVCYYCEFEGRFFLLPANLPYDIFELKKGQKVFHNERIAPFIDDHEFDAGIKYIKGEKCYTVFLNSFSY